MSQLQQQMDIDETNATAATQGTNDTSRAANRAVQVCY